MNLPTPFLNIIDEILFTPFEEGGRTKDGCDCWGLVVILYDELFNIPLPTYDTTAYKGMSNLAITSDSINQIKQDEEFDFVEVESPQYGDFILVDMLGRPVHIGFVLTPTEMIHITRQSGVTVENFRGEKWNRKIHGFYRHKRMFQTS